MIKGIISILSLLWVLLVGTPNNNKVRLDKKPTKQNYTLRINCWIQRNFYIICVLAIVFLLIVFVFVCFALVGVSAVESGAMRNFINGGVI